MPEQVNLIIYLNPVWDTSWGGNLELWNGSHDKLITPVQQISPTFNSAVLFRTSDISWHGVPNPVLLTVLIIDFFGNLKHVFTDQLST
jgi:Rps23 Pro-64 3,4-dihydroxylase Tpa1-like proline 4-hydroxylase